MSRESLPLEHLKNHDIVIFAGAGLSMAAPALVPGWDQLNELIFDGLCTRYEEDLNKSDFLSPIRTIVTDKRRRTPYPPEYQAQLIHEYCGTEYFRLLQSADVSLAPAPYRSLAQLAATGRVKAIVTTSVDCLIEQALTACDVDFNVAFDADTYASCFHQINDAQLPSKLNVIKIHGCVCDHLSLVDTLKRREQGRNQFLEACLEQLLNQYCFIYAGFSARDLESDPDYLGLTKAATNSPGLVFVQWPDAPQLGHGAVVLTSAYGSKATVITADNSEFFNMLADHTVSVDSLKSLPQRNGKQLVEKSLALAISKCSPVFVCTCLAALFDINGQTRSAYDILRTHWRYLLSGPHAKPDILRFHLLCGRLGAALGHNSIAPRTTSDRFDYGVQNLLSVRDQDERFEAWAGLSLLWSGSVKKGYHHLASSQIDKGDHAKLPEHQLDNWFALAEYRYFSNEGIDAFEHWYVLLALAQSNADLARTARVAAMVYLHLCDNADNVVTANQTYQQVLRPQVFARSKRLNDPINEGLVSLARARWFYNQSDTSFASEFIEKAMQNFSQAGMVRWYEYARIEHSRILVDQGSSIEAERLLKNIKVSLDQYALLSPRFHDARAHWFRSVQQYEYAANSYQEAASCCEYLGLGRWQKVYETAASDVLHYC